MSRPSYPALETALRYLQVLRLEIRLTGDQLDYLEMAEGALHEHREELEELEDLAQYARFVMTANRIGRAVEQHNEALQAAAPPDGERP